MKYYIFEFRSKPTGAHFGRRSFLAQDERDAWKKVREFLRIYWPFVTHTITLLTVENT